MKMIRRCAWCKKIMNIEELENEDLTSLSITDGICVSCTFKFLPVLAYKNVARAAKKEIDGQDIPESEKKYLDFYRKFLANDENKNVPRETGEE